MVRKIFLSILIAFGISSLAFADDIFDISEFVEALPNVKEGVAFSLDSNEFKSLTTTELFSWNGVSFEAGYATPDVAALVFSYKIIELGKYIDVPIIDLIEFNIGYYVGASTIDIEQDSIDWEFDHGPSLTLIDIKF
jgi:hypothetical protein